MPDDNGLIATYYRIDGSRPAFQLQGGLRAWPVIDRRDTGLKLMAVETQPHLPARPRIARAGGRAPVPHLVLPIEYGLGWDPAGKPGWYIVADCVPANQVKIGPQPWREAELMTHVLQPAAAALATLAALGLTHRAINADNLFRAGPRDPVTLGPFWAAPPASQQPAIYEPTYMARCLPNGRGEGTIADDVYALGVTLLALALGRMPMTELDNAAMLDRKVTLGSFAALTEGALLPPLLADLLRGMLADDPDHRPSAAMLLRPEQARARRLATRPPRRAQLPLNVGGVQAWTARELAWALGLRPERGHVLLRSGEVERWLRRCLGDPQLGMQVEDVTRRTDTASVDDARAQGLILMRGIAAIDPLAPLIWRGTAIQPDGLGTALVGASPEATSSLEQVVLNEAVGHFYAASPRRAEPQGFRDEQRDWRAWLTARGPAGGIWRLTYGTNPMLPCASKLLGGRPVVRAADLLDALDQSAPDADRTRPPIDAHIAAFLAARIDPAFAGELAYMSSFAAPQDRLALLRLFGRLQARLHPDPLPGLAGWLVSSGLVSLDEWKNRRTRAELEEKAKNAAQAGQIAAMLDVVDDAAARQADATNAKAAAQRVETLRQMLAQIAQTAPGRAEAAELLGVELVTGAGLIASLGAALALAIP